jgi:hypothetical protein
MKNLHSITRREFVTVVAAAGATQLTNVRAARGSCGIAPSSWLRLRQVRRCPGCHDVPLPVDSSVPAASRVIRTASVVAQRLRGLRRR